MIKYSNCLKNWCQLTKNNILVIGNGFDLACGLKTSYSDFVKYLVFIPVLNNYKMLIKYGQIKEFQSINELEKEIREEDKLFFFMALKTLSDAEKTDKILKMLKHPFIKDFFEVVFSIDLFSIILEPFSPLYNNSKLFSSQTASEFYGFKELSFSSDFWNYLDVKKIVFNKGIYTCISIINSHLNYAKKSINGWLDVEQFIEFLVLNSKELSLKFYPSYFKEKQVLYSSPLFENPNLALEYYKGLKFFSKLFSDYLCCIYSKQSSLLICGEQENNKVTKEYAERLFYELDIITSKNFANYFLIVSDYVKFAKDNDILVGPGRGSAASSLVAYLLDITTIDPLKYNLLFERFLNPERATMPDIDVDFEDARRYDVIRYVRQKYGEEKFAHI